jgi:large subunit ribosomal protein L21
MLVVFEINGKQYDGLVGKDIEVDLMEAATGNLVIDKVLLFKKSDSDVLIGKPYVADAKVNASIKGVMQDKKIKVFRYRRRKNSKKMSGHRQKYTVIRLDSVVCQGQEFKAASGT